jgi:putative PIN family toxin of toxin-antitoxin system
VALLVIDPNVLVSGLIGEGPPAEVVDLVRYGVVRCAACPKLLGELEGVLRRPRFRRYIEPEEIDAYLQVLRAIATAQPDPTDLDDIDCRDPSDRYLVALARQVGADVLVSGDRDLTELDDPDPPVLTPAAVLDRYDPVPRRPFQAVRGTCQIILSGPKSTGRRVHRSLQAAGFVTQRTSGVEQHPTIAWAQALSHAGGDEPSGEFQQERLTRAQEVGAEEGYRLWQHGVVIGGPSQFRVVRHRGGEELFRMFAEDPEATLSQLARQLGIPREDLKLEEAPGSWDVPRQ